MTTIEHKDEDIDTDEMRYSLPETNNEIKFYFLKYCSEFSVSSQPNSDSFKLEEDKLDLILKELWEKELESANQYVSQFYQSLPLFDMKIEENSLIETWIELILLSENY